MLSDWFFFGTKRDNEITMTITAHQYSLHNLLPTGNYEIIQKQLSFTLRNDEIHKLFLAIKNLRKNSKIKNHEKRLKCLA